MVSSSPSLGAPLASSLASPRAEGAAEADHQRVHRDSGHHGIVPSD